MRLYVSLIVVSVASMCLGQSVADVARASQERHQAAGTRKVVTDDDMPAKPNAEAAAGTTTDTAMHAEMDHLRTVYLDLCSDPAVRRSNQLSPEMKQKLKEAAEPLQKRLQEISKRVEQSESEGLSHEEQAEVNAVTPADGRALTLEERQKVGAIRERYAEKRSERAGTNSEGKRQSLVVLGELISMTSDCSHAGSLRH